MTADTTPESLTDLYDRNEYATGKYVESSDHIPDEDSVLATYATDYYMVSVSGTATPEGRAAAFSRWLASHDAEDAEDLR